MQALAGDKAAADAELGGSEAACLTRGGFIHTRNFKQHVAWQHHGHPEFGRAFTFTHSHFRRTLRDGLVWENAAENLAFALQEAGDGDAARFDVDVLHPAALKRLKSELTEVELVAAGGVTTAIATL